MLIDFVTLFQFQKFLTKMLLILDNKKLIMKDIIKYPKDFKTIKFIVRILQYISISFLLICCCMTLATDVISSFAINYISVITAVLTLYLSVAALIIISVYNKIKGNLIWEPIRREVILVFTTIIVLLILGVIINYIKDI